MFDNISMYIIRILCKIIRYINIVFDKFGYTGILCYKESSVFNRVSSIKIYDLDDNSMHLRNYTDRKLRNLSIKNISQDNIKYIINDYNAKKISFHFVPSYILSRSDVEKTIIDDNTNVYSMQLN